MPEQQHSFGPPPVVLKALDEIDPLALESLAQWIEQRGLRTPITQIVGFAQFTAKTARIATEAHTTSSTYADPSVSGGAGPTISGLANGQYLILHGGSGAGTLASNVRYFQAVSVNGGTPVDADGCEFGQDGNVSGATALTATLTGGNNELKCVYRSSDGTDRGNVRNRWIVALRYGNS